MNSSGAYNPGDIGAIGISYQMHGLVMLDKDNSVLRNSIIWCDSRAVSYGEAAFKNIGEEKCLSCLLNSPGNFTAAKLAWVKENEPEVFDRIHKIMLPGDFVAQRLTGNTTTTPSALSEGILWDFKKGDISEDVLNQFGFDKSFIPAVKDVFAEHGKLSRKVAEELSLKEGIPVTYKAGDQPNNALSLNVLQPGEVAATAGTSGVIYGVSDQLTYDPQSRVNSFAHVTHNNTRPKAASESPNFNCISGMREAQLAKQNPCRKNSTDTAILALLLSGMAKVSVRFTAVLLLQFFATNFNIRYKSKSLAFSKETLCPSPFTSPSVIKGPN